MKKYCLFLLTILLSMSCSVEAHYCYNHAYLVHKDYYEQEHNFKNCQKHYLVREVTEYYYSNGTRRIYTNNTIYDVAGNVIATNCRDVNHFIYGNKHYFSFYRNKKYNIIDEEGNIITSKNYKKMEEIAPNKFLVKLNKKYGVIDINENKLVPIKYNKFKKINNNLYLTKLNGYWGMVNLSKKIDVRNEYDKITEIHDCLLLKKNKKYGLADLDGKIILNVEYDKIEKLDEYILVKKDDKYGIYSSNGQMLCDTIYKKVRQERNVLEGKLNKSWETIINL